MSARGWWSLILIVLAIVVMFFERSLLGAMAGSFLLVVMLFLWVLPGNLLQRDARDADPTARGVSYTVLGLGLGLLAAAAAAFILPPRYFSWLIIAVGLILIAWLVWQRRDHG